MSVICQNFVQNAWRKDLCSNCFKSEADHSDCSYRNSGDVAQGRRYIPQATSLYQSRGLSMNINLRPLHSVQRIQDRIACRDFGSQTNVAEKNNNNNNNGNSNSSNSDNRTDSAKGILKDCTPKRNKNRRSSVGFTSDEPLIIGYGGRDYDSDDSPWELGSDDGSVNLELLDLTEEDRSITKLTKNNTEFNSVNENLIASPAVRENSTALDKNLVNERNSHRVDNDQFKNYKTPSTTMRSVNPSDRKLEQSYYYSAKTDPVKSSLPKFGEKTNYLNAYKEMSLIRKDIAGIINHVENNKGHCQKLDNISNSVEECNYNAGTEQDQVQKCQNTNSSRYLLITKVQDSCGSDSDYSTSKQTNGESSTDSESFHDAEEMMMIPCSSFLHGASTIESQNNMKNYVLKPFETSSVSSADTSAFSDDSDSQKPQESLNNSKGRNNHSKSSSSSSSANKIPVAKCATIQNKGRGNLVQCNTESKRKQGPNQAQQDSRPVTSNCESANSMQNSINSTRQKNQREESKYGEKKLVSQMKVVSPPRAPTIAPLHTNINKTPIKSNPVPETEYSKSNDTTPSVAKSIPLCPSNSIECIPDRKYSDNYQTNNSVIGSQNKDSETVHSTCKAEKSYVAPESNNVDQKANANRINIAALQKERRLTNDNHKAYLESENHDTYALEEDAWKSMQCHSTSSVSPADAEDHQVYYQQDSYSPESNSSSTRSSPNSKLNRESKLAALALELEKVRCDAASNSVKTCNAQDARFSKAGIKTTPKYESDRSVNNFETPVSRDTTGKYPSIRRGRSLISPNQMPKSSLPDLLPETTTKLKKGRFSLKKLLKRGKDSDTLVINNPNDYNPKAWKRQTFDRSRLSLEIVHPMDMTNDPPTSTDSTPTEEKRNTIFSDPSARQHGKYNSGTPRARSLSALPHLGSCVSEISDLGSSGLRRNDISSLDRPQLDNMPRKAGTVAERSKKYRAPRRTPSFSELRTSTTTSGRSTGSGAPTERPPKPPPPPRGKSLSPPQLPIAPPPPPQEKSRNQMTVPVRPPPPKTQEAIESSLSGQMNSSPKNEREHILGDYANLGDIRLNITPKKPQRPSAISFARDALETDEDQSHQGSPIGQSEDINQVDNTYECLEAQEEEDHYTYLDEMEVKSGRPEKPLNAPENTMKTQYLSKCSPVEKNPLLPPGNNASSSIPRTSIILKKPWMNLHASYAAIAAANYESLAELITTAISEGLEQFQKSASTLRWNDFDLESDEPIQTLDDKFVYNAIYKSQPKTKVTLMVTTQKQHTTQNRNPSRPPVLATFNDFLPKQHMDIISKHHNFSDIQKAMIYVLQRSKTTTVDQFAQDSASFQTNQHVHLRNACFVLLQLIHTLKSLQAEGIEEIDYDLGRILLLHTDVDKPPILVLLPGDKIYLTMTDYYKADVATRKTTLCQTTLQLLFHLLQIRNAKELNTCVVNGEGLASPVAHTFGVIAKILSEEKASSLTQAKGLLEYMLWGPVDIKTTGTEEDIDVILQRWLDLQRAQMVKSLVSNLHLKISSHTGFHVYEEYQLIFLLQATVKSLKDIIFKL